MEHPKLDLLGESETLRQLRREWLSACYRLNSRSMRDASYRWDDDLREIARLSALMDAEDRRCRGRQEGS